MTLSSQSINFDETPVNSDWCFKNVRSTEQWTHGYHRYPAKFLPNLVKKIIEDYTLNDDLIADFFAGCGTTLVEAKVHGRRSIGVDINPVAELITKVKISPIKPSLLSKELDKLLGCFDSYQESDYHKILLHKRIDYWFVPENKYKIAFLYEKILLVSNPKIRDFFLVSLSHILKNCSRWLQSSTKPQIDPDKKVINPFISFKTHTRFMQKRNEEFYKQLVENGDLGVNCEIYLEDARKTSIVSGSVGMIITSPPYVTSYEYADIHQLTAYWFEYVKDLKEFRSNFIGTFFSKNTNLESSSVMAQQIIDDLSSKDKRTAREVANYFNDMYNVAKEMYRVLKNGGYTCLVIGNTTFKNTKIKSAEVFFEMLNGLGFEMVEVIKRSIPHKLIPTIRDKKTGKFSKKENKNSKLVYPEEYILIAKKS